MKQEDKIALVLTDELRLRLGYVRLQISLDKYCFHYR